MDACGSREAFGTVDGDDDGDDDGREEDYHPTDDTQSSLVFLLSPLLTIMFNGRWRSRGAFGTTMTMTGERRTTT